MLKGEELPAIHPLVDLNNCLSVALAVPCCIVAEGSFTPPVVLRAGRAGESYESLRGPFNLEGKPLLADAEGPFGTPITDSQRVKVTGDTRRAWMVAYLPAGVVPPEAAARALDDLLAGPRSPRIEEHGTSGRGDEHHPSVHRSRRRAADQRLGPRAAQARRRAQFSVDAAEMDERHHLTYDTYEAGKISLSVYLRRIIFWEPREFTEQQVVDFMLGQAKCFPEMIELVQAGQGGATASRSWW